MNPVEVLSTSTLCHQIMLQRSVAEGVRDLDEEAVIRVDVIEVNGSVTSLFLSHEFNTPEPHRGFRSEFSESSATLFKAVRSDDPRNF